DNIAWDNKGNALINLDRIEDAIECYNKALELNEKDIIAWNNKGNALNLLGKKEQAIECYKKALKIDPNYSSAKKNLELAKENLKKE
ncbi:MAG TPA: tetratricopeptide repeat protein, partial [Methanosarcinales archaeon]|nr:tetratricopeptide repeat protein [Methanosarcinales archaeon]